MYTKNESSLAIGFTVYHHTTSSNEAYHRGYKSKMKHKCLHVYWAYVRLLDHIKFRVNKLYQKANQLARIKPIFEHYVDKD